MRTHLRVALAVLVLIVAACGDDDTSPTTTAPDETTTTVAATSTTAAPTTTEAPGDAIGSLLATFEMTPLRTTYLFGEGSDQTEVTLSQDPTQDPPVEAVLVPGADAKLITIGDETVFCDTRANQCFSVPGAAGGGFSEGLLGPFAGGLFMAGQLDSIPGATMTEETVEVAGRSGICFTFTPPDAAGFDTELIRQCIDAELGFTLLLQSQPAGGDLETVMELIEFGEPLDDDFIPTGPVTATP